MPKLGHYREVIMVRRLSGPLGAWFLGVGILGWLVGEISPLRSAGDNKKAPIPSAAAQAKIGTLLAELFGKEYARAKKDPLARSQLAVSLLQEGRETRDDLTARYVLLREARTLAAQAGDCPTALQAIEDLMQDFAISPAEVWHLKIQALESAGQAVSAPEALHTVVDSALVLLQDALASDEYEAGLDLLATADAAARKLKNVPLVSGIRRRILGIQAAQKEFAHWKPFALALRQHPQDAGANLEMGKYYAFLKGDWDRGLPHLARGKDKDLNQLARLDISEPAQTGQQTELGQKWFQLALHSQGKMEVHLLLRAYYWYVRSLAGLEGAAREEAEKQMQAISQRLPPEYRAGEIVEEIRKIETNTGPIYGVVFSPDGRRAASAGADHSVHLWDITSGKEVRRFDGHSGRIWALAFSADGRRLASGGFDNSIRLWDLASGRDLKRLPGHTDYVRSLAFSRDGRYLLSGGDDHQVRLWNTDTGLETSSFPPHDHAVWSVALSPDGKQALSGGLDRAVRLFRLDGRETTLVQQMTGHQDTVLSVAFSPDGRQALSGSTDKTLRLWDLQTGKLLRTFSGHSGHVHSVALSPDGRRALSASQDRTVRLWDVQGGKEIRRLEGHQEAVWSVGFSRDGRFAISGGQDGSMRIWGGKNSSLGRRP